MAESNQPETSSQALQRRLSQAYLKVFGAEGGRTEFQQLVMRDMESFCHAYRLSVEAVVGGECSEANTIVNEGRRSYWLRARGQILAAQAPAPEPLKVSRKRQKP